MALSTQIELVASIRFLLPVFVIRGDKDALILFLDWAIVYVLAYLDHFLRLAGFRVLLLDIQNRGFHAWPDRHRPHIGHTGSTRG
jgi:hypothetical protein